MDILLSCLILVLFINIILLCNIYLVKTKTYKKYKHIYYLLLLLVNIILIYFLYVKPKIQHYKEYNQSGGKSEFKTKNKISKLKNICGLPKNYYPTSHCFADRTHQTCCQLGPKARKYADATKNPIGEASIKAFKKKYGRDPKPDELTSWCTCFGSEVCSYYAQKFNDGTKIKFVNNPGSLTDIRENVSPQCEGYFKNKYDIRSHLTPGVNSVTKNKKTSFCKKDGIRKNIFL